MGILDKLFKKEISEEKLNEFFQKKEKIMDGILGEQFHLVSHAIVPFSAGGAVDMYIYPHAIEGTAFATMELVDYVNKGPIPNRNGMYELLAFTKIKVNDQRINDVNDPFCKLERHLCGIFTSIGNYSFHAKLEPGETCEIPGKEGEENICLIFDDFKKDNIDFIIDGKKYGFLVCIELFRSEMEYAMKNGSAELFKLLKEKGFYPYSDLDRGPVV
ncbi:MAG TPA: suppressor of fused domain protein [Clostridia bacterium]|nr:suppressor of fused domain protein [Clostridia bacterium]